MVLCCVVSLDWSARCSIPQPRVKSHPRYYSPRLPRWLKIQPIWVRTFSDVPFVSFAAFLLLLWFVRKVTIDFRAQFVSIASP